MLSFEKNNTFKNNIKTYFVMIKLISKCCEHKEASLLSSPSDNFTINSDTLRLFNLEISNDIVVNSSFSCLPLSSKPKNLKVYVSFFFLFLHNELSFFQRV